MLRALEFDLETLGLFAFGEAPFSSDNEILPSTWDAAKKVAAEAKGLQGITDTTDLRDSLMSFDNALSDLRFHTPTEYTAEYRKDLSPAQSSAIGKLHTQLTFAIAVLDTLGDSANPQLITP